MEHSAVDQAKDPEESDSCTEKPWYCEERDSRYDTMSARDGLAREIFMSKIDEVPEYSGLEAVKELAQFSVFSATIFFEELDKAAG